MIFNSILMVLILTFGFYMALSFIFCILFGFKEESDKSFDGWK